MSFGTFWAEESKNSHLRWNYSTSIFACRIAEADSLSTLLPSVLWLRGFRRSCETTNAERREVTALKAVASTANQLLQFGMRIWSERVLTMDQGRISIIQRERSIEAKSVIRQEDRTTSVMWIPNYPTKARSEASEVWRHDCVWNILGTFPELFRVQQID